MVKVIRKYRQWAMGVFGVLLMVTFLFSGTGSSLFSNDPLKAPVAVVDGQKLLRKDFEQSNREFEALKTYLPDVISQDLGIENGTHWFLLVREAERAGLVGEAGDGADWLPELADMRMLQIARLTVLQEMPQYRDMLRSNVRLLDMFAMEKLRNPQWVATARADVLREMENSREPVAAHSQMTVDQFNKSLSRLRGVVRLINTYVDAARLSDRQLLADLRRNYEEVTLDAVVIGADRVSAEVPEPGPAEVEAQYEKYRTLKPGTGEFGFGYVQPRRVKLEWMRINRTILGQTISIDPIEVQKRYQLNKARYPGDFATTVKAQIENEIRDEKVAEVMSQIDAVYKRMLAKALPKGKPGEIGRKLPPDWDAQRPKMEALARDLVPQVKDATGVTIPMPEVTVSASKWTRLDELDELPGIGGAQFVSGAQRGTFAQVVGTLQEFVPPVNLGLQSRVPFESVLTDSAGDRYYFTILDWRQESSADSLDEVRGRVSADLRRLAAFKKLQGELGTYRALAISDGLSAVGKLFAKPKVEKTADRPEIPEVPAIPVSQDVRVTRLRVTPALPELDDQAFRDAVLEAGEKLGRTTAPTPENVADRTLAMALPRTLAVVVAQLGYPSPITEERLRVLRNEEARSFLMEDLRTAQADTGSPFSLESLKKRVGYKEISEDEGKGKDAKPKT